MNQETRSGQQGPATSSDSLPKVAPSFPARGQPTGWRKWLYRLVAMTLVPAFLLGLLELCLRLAGYGYPTDFFVPREIEGESVLVENWHFGRRFFPRQLLRNANPSVFPVPKSPGTFRIFILGESAAMGYPAPSFNFGRILKVMLQDAYPDTRFEVINTGMTAINSHVVLPIARDCADHQPDLFIVYMGNNEVVGPYGPSGVLGPFAPSLRLIRFSIAAKTTRTGQLVSSLVQGLGLGRKTPGFWEGMAMFARSQIAATDPRLESMYANFERNLDDICVAGRETGAPVLVCTLGSNLCDSAPFASLPTPGLSPDQAAEWQRLYEEGQSLESAGKYSQAIECYQRAIAIDEAFADLQFRLARCFSALKNVKEARQCYLLARNLDALRFRPDTRINEIIRATAGGREGQGIYLVDADRAFEQASPGEMPGDNFFYEHVHMNFEGSHLLARTILEQVARLLPGPSSRAEAGKLPLEVRACQARLAYTDWKEVNTLHEMENLFSQPPFINQLDGRERDQRFQKQRKEMQARLKGDGLKEAVAVYRRALARSPEDIQLHNDFAPLLVQCGQLEEAAAQLTEVRQRLPHRPEPILVLAHVLAEQGNIKTAEALCAEAVQHWPDHSLTHNGQGAVLARQGKFAEAAVSFREALRLDPIHSQIRHNLARVLVDQKLPGEAVKLLEAGLGLEPRSAELHAALGGLLAYQGDLDGAIFHLSEAVRLQPDMEEVAKALDEFRRMKASKTPGRK